MARELLRAWDKAVKTTPDQLASEKEDIARRERELLKSERLHKARKTIHAGFTALFEAAAAGDAEAAKTLADAAIAGVVFLQFLETQQAELLKPAARRKIRWPVLASDEPGWEKEAALRMARLGLGQDFIRYKAAFRQARGADANLPARLWAKAAVRTIEETHFRCLCFAHLLHDFGSPSEVADFFVKNGWDYGRTPSWVLAVVELGAFSTETLPQWKRAVRKMIREQMPDFHLRPEWEPQRNSAMARGRDTPGEIQNAILDDIASALERIAPIKEMPKPAC